jgi:hypothetical protein
VRLVNLVYRHLATVPGALEWAWYTVGEHFQAGEFAERSKALVPGPEGLPALRISMQSAGLSAADAGQVIVTLDAYNRANPMNALSLRVIALALESGRPATPIPLVAPPGVDLRVLLPMMPLDGLDSAGAPDHRPGEQNCAVAVSAFCPMAGTAPAIGRLDGRFVGRRID